MKSDTGHYNYHFVLWHFLKFFATTISAMLKGLEIAAKNQFLYFRLKNIFWPLAGRKELFFPYKISCICMTLNTKTSQNDILVTFFHQI